MKLKKLIKDIAFQAVKGSKEVQVSGLSSNSKLVGPGHLFIAKKGSADDGTRYIPEAVLAGAQAILTDIYDPGLKEVVQLIHPDPKLIEPLLAAEFYDNPSRELFMVGVTGTNGKTTTTFIIKYLLDALGSKSGLIGTIEYIIGESRYPATRTTPDVISNHKMLREMIQQGARSAVMEVTSHALHQNRVEKIEYDAAVFTNLTPEHLDYHLNMHAYAEMKRKLFQELEPGSSVAIFNADSEWTPFMQEGCLAHKLTYGLTESADIKAEKARMTPEGTYFDLVVGEKSYPAFTPMAGSFNLYNTLAAIAVLGAKGFSFESILEALKGFPGVPGRLEYVPNPENLKVFVDFAHTEDALKNVITSIREFITGKVIVVFGCGGDRDRQKRPHMARMVEMFADWAIVTNDNPRTEEPEAIASEITAGFLEERFEVILDRRQAIHKALEMAEPEDVILVAGKGHEPYQIFARQTVEFDDRKVVLEELSSLNKAVL